MTADDLRAYIELNKEMLAKLDELLNSLIGE